MLRLNHRQGGYFPFKSSENGMPEIFEAERCFVTALHAGRPGMSQEAVYDKGS